MMKLGAILQGTENWRKGAGGKVWRVKQELRSSGEDSAN